MVCIYCSNDTQVSNSRLQKRSNSVWRRRSCKACAGVFTTLETADFASAIVVRGTHNSLKAFDRDQLLLTVYESCKHRPKALSEATSLTNTIIGDLLKHIGRDGIVEQETLHTIIRTVLKRFDPAAATIYTAYSK